jgi:hypothetical protein
MKNESLRADQVAIEFLAFHLSREKGRKDGQGTCEVGRERTRQRQNE